jgi:hypothetical protein
MSKTTLLFRAEPEVKEIVEQLAADERRSVSQFLRNLVEDAVISKKRIKSARAG